MVRSIVSWSIRFRFLVLAAAAGTLIGGAALLRDVPVDVLPEFTPPYVEVQTEALGLSAEEVEQLVTVPLEADLLNGVAWLESIESQSVTGLSSIVLTFEPGTDPIRARQMVAERLTQAHALPNVSRPPTMLQPLSSANRLLMVSLSSHELSLIDMSVLARWTIRPRLMGVPGVANVSIWGQRERQLQVLVDPERLQRSGVSLDEVVRTTGNALWVSPLSYLEASTPGTGGFIDTPNQRLGIQHFTPISGASDLAQVAIADAQTTSGTPLRLGDVADVVEDHQPLIGDAIVDGSTGLLLVIERFPEANTLTVSRDVEEAIAALLPGLSGITVDTSIFRSASFVEDSIAGLALAALLGLLLASLAIALALADWRAGLVSLLTIPLSLAAAALALYLLGATLNVMVVCGFLIVVGLIVDDIAVSAACARPRPAGASDRTSGTDRLATSLATVRGPLVHATLIVGLVALPLLLVGGSLGPLLPPLVLAYTLALAASALVAATVTPALVSMVLPRRAAASPERGIGQVLGDRYEALLRRLLPRARWVLAGTLVGTAAAVAIFGLVTTPRIASGLLPTVRDRNLLVQWDAAPGTSRTEMARIVTAASAELHEIDGIADVGAHVGRAILSDQVVEVNSGEIWLTVAPGVDYDATLAQVRSVVDGYPGLARDVATYTSDRVTQWLGGSDGDVVVHVYGQDLDVLRSKAAEVQSAMAEVAGLTDVTVHDLPDQPTVSISVDLEAAERFGLKPGDVRRAATTLLSGVTVGSLFEDQKVFDVVVWGVPEIRGNLTDISNLLIDTPDGGLVPLGDVATVRVASAPQVIYREAVARRIDVSAQVSGRDLAATTDNVRSALASVTFPLEYHAEIEPVGLQSQAALGTLLLVGTAVVIVALLLLQAALGTWRLALLAGLALPATVLGGAIAGLLLPETAALAVLAGLLAVLGIAVRNTMTLWARTRHVEGEADRVALVVRGARDGLGPTIATAIGTALVLLPAALMAGGPGFELVAPMAITILGGLVTGTAVTLIAAPAFFYLSGSRFEPESVEAALAQDTDTESMGARQ